MNNDTFLWVEKFRPKNLEQTILPEQLKNTLSAIVKSGEVPNMIFTGTSGLGKTTAAKAICNQLGLDYIMINGSEEGNIDTLRGRIKQFASTVSLSGGYKVVILDEADYLNPQSTQPALRGFIEQFSDNCRFILTCNYKNRLIEPLHSRCSVYEFNTTRKELASLAGEMFKRAKKILDDEGVTYDNKELAQVISKYAPDWRRVLNELQRNSASGTLVVGSSDTLTSQLEDLYRALKDKDFKKTRTWVANNMDVDTATIFRGIFNTMQDRVQPASIPQLVLILADYQYKDAFVADHELNMTACMVEIMADVQFK